jgi:simple sugar transport system permease protein
VKYTHILLVILVVAFVFFSLLAPYQFLSANNLRTVMSQLPEFAIMALGMMIVIVTGGINLSIAATSALCGIVSGLFLAGQLAAGLSDPMVVLLTIAVGLGFAILTGAFNGSLVAYVGVTSIIVTIGARAVFTGVGLVFTRGGSISGFQPAYYFVGNSAPLGIPFPFFLFLAVVIFMYILLHRTPWGRRVFVIGSNSLAARYSGIRVQRVLFQVYVLSSLLAGLAALIMISRYNSAKVTLGTSYLLQTVAASVLGGTSIYGGTGSVWGTIIAVGILQVISNGFNILGVNRFLIDASMGAILIIALTVNYFLRKQFFASLFNRRKSAGNTAA